MSSRMSGLFKSKSKADVQPPPSPSSTTPPPPVVVGQPSNRMSVNVQPVTTTYSTPCYHCKKILDFPAAAQPGGVLQVACTACGGSGFFLGPLVFSFFLLLLSSSFFSSSLSLLLSFAESQSFLSFFPVTPRCPSSRLSPSLLTIRNSPTLPQSVILAAHTTRDIPLNHSIPTLHLHLHPLIRTLHQRIHTILLLLRVLLLRSHNKEFLQEDTDHPTPHQHHRRFLSRLFHRYNSIHKVTDNRMQGLNRLLDKRKSNSFSSSN